MTTSRLNHRILVVLLIIPLILVAANLVFAGGNPPDKLEEKTEGPVVSGSLVFTPQTENDPTSYVVFDFNGKCKGQDIDVTIESDDITFDAVNEENMQDYRWNIDDLPDRCAPDPAAVLIIRKITDFVDMDPDLIKYAEVQMIFVVPKGK